MRCWVQKMRASLLMRWRIAGGEARPKRQRVQKEGSVRRGASERAAEEAMVEEGEGGED